MQPPAAALSMATLGCTGAPRSTPIERLLDDPLGDAKDALLHDPLVACEAVLQALI